VKKRQKSVFALAMIAVLIALSVCLPGLAAAGDLEPPAVPDDDASAMYTIEDLYDYLDTGVAGTKRTGGFAGPGSGPGPTGRTLDEVHAKIIDKCITCEGTLHGSRWCDQENGTVKDMTTGLVWLKDALWGGMYLLWAGTLDGENAHDPVAQLEDGVGGLTDGSARGDWHLPTKEELYGLFNGTEAVRCSDQQAFTGLLALCWIPFSPPYWSSTTDTSSPSNAWCVNKNTGEAYSLPKDTTCYVWPVRTEIPYLE